MASNYPGSLDSFDTIASDKKTSDAVGGRTHRAMHNDLGDAIESVQTELGTNPSGSDATVAARLTAIETGARMGTGSIGATALADNAVDTAAIQDGAVTAAKLATTGRFLFPTGAANGYGYTGGAVHLEGGSSSPEGVVTANPGSTFLQTSGAATVTGMLSWRKATGTGNTGWVAEGALADTGWRDIAAGLTGLTDTTARILHIRRVGSLVALRINWNAGASPTAGDLPIPAGFRYASGLYNAGTVAFDGAGQLTASVVTADGGDSLILTPVANQNPRHHWQYLMPDGVSWPSSLPYSAA